jgi:hypothetical protein
LKLAKDELFLFPEKQHYFCSPPQAGGGSGAGFYHAQISQEEISMSTSTETTRETFALAFDPTIGIGEWVRRGNYTRPNPDINERNFKLTLSGTRKIVLYDPKGAVSSDEMIRRMKADGYKPAGIDDALAMGAQFPERQRQNPIVFLGTTWRDPDGLQHVPVLSGWCGGRRLGLDWFDFVWDGRYRFAALREK